MDDDHKVLRDTESIFQELPELDRQAGGIASLEHGLDELAHEAAESIQSGLNDEDLVDDSPPVLAPLEETIVDRIRNRRAANARKRFVKAGYVRLSDVDDSELELEPAHDEDDDDDDEEKDENYRGE